MKDIVIQERPVADSHLLSSRLACGANWLLYWRSMALSTLIVDDERPARDELTFLLKAFPEINVVGQGKNGLEAVALIKEHHPDLVFLDVQMPGLDGFGVLKQLAERGAAKAAANQNEELEALPQIVFATAYEQYAVRAFDVNAVDYLLKPFDRARVQQAVERVKSRMAGGPEA